jgi:hypothetical protein
MTARSGAKGLLLRVAAPWLIVACGAPYGELDREPLERVHSLEPVEKAETPEPLRPSPPENGDGGRSASEAPDAGMCGPGMECRPGASRYCDLTQLEWTKSTCDATGHWAACAPAAPPEESAFPKQTTCAMRGLCCQFKTDGPFVDSGSGACGAAGCG